MILVYKPLNLQIDLIKSKISLLVIESPSIFSKFVEDAQNSIFNESSDLVILEHDIEQDLSKNFFICYCPFLVNLNDKRFLNTVIAQLQSVLTQNENYLNKYNELTSKLESLIFDICDESDFNLEISESPTISNLFKLYNVRIEESVSLLEKTVDYLSIISKIAHNPVVMFCNLKSYFNVDELQMIYKHAVSMDVKLVILEPVQSSTLIDQEEITIVDKDLCII